MKPFVNSCLCGSKTLREGCFACGAYLVSINVIYIIMTIAFSITPLRGYKGQNQSTKKAILSCISPLVIILSVPFLIIGAKYKNRFPLLLFIIVCLVSWPYGLYRCSKSSFSDPSIIVLLSLFYIIDMFICIIAVMLATNYYLQLRLQSLTPEPPPQPTRPASKPQPRPAPQPASRPAPQPAPKSAPVTEV